jgi:fumagillin biosynthesis cytochrome P450 monooxygenase
MTLMTFRAFLHDPKVYKNPEQFLPERYLGDNPEPSPEKSGQFGYGRRICPGKGLADQSGWLLIAQTLSAFNIRQKKDQYGNEIEVRVEGKEGLIHYPLPYVMNLEPRSEKHVEMIKAVEAGLTWDQGDSEELKQMGILRTYD